MTDYAKIAMEVAENSNCEKRKVGAVVVTEDTYYTGWNYNTDENKNCEDSEGNTKDSVVHAEIVALENCNYVPLAIYITHKPCDNCIQAIVDAGIRVENIHVVEQFMKFDKDKPALYLLPKSALLALAEGQELFALYLKAMFKAQEDKKFLKELQVLTSQLLKITSLIEVGAVLAFGAKKYKPNNWRRVDSLDRYWSALGRHLSDVDKSAKSKDKETGLTHAAHALTNILFILELKDLRK